MAVRDLTLTLPGRESVGAQPNPTGVVVPSDGVAERAVRGALDPVAVRMRTVERLHRGTSTDRDPDTQARSGEAARLDRQRVRAKRAKERQRRSLVDAVTASTRTAEAKSGARNAAPAGEVLAGLAASKARRRAEVAAPVAGSTPDDQADTWSWSQAADDEGPATAVFSALFASTQMGVNTVPLGYDESEKFGSDEGIAADCQELGAAVLRHVGRFDLTWKNLVGDDVPVPRNAAAIPGLIASALNVDKRNAAAIPGLIASALNVGKWASFFTLLHEHGLRVVLTCVAFGERHVKGEDSTGDAWYAEDTDRGIREPLLLRWDSSHPNVIDDGAGITDDDYKRLDVGNEYERGYLEAMAEGIADLLAGVAAVLGSDVVEEVVAGLELFDEMDAMNVRLERATEGTTPWREKIGDAEASAGDWAGAFFQVALRLRQVLDTAALDLPIWLPGLASHYETVTTDKHAAATRNSWDYKVAFVAAFLDQLGALASASGRDIADLSAGLNYHWDHRAKEKTNPDGTKKLGPQHIAHMLGEVRALRDLLDDHGFEHTDLSVLRSGISVLDGDEFVPWFTDGDIERFQAWEVWRRLAGGLASDADMVGWQAWMSSWGLQESEEDSKEFYGMGLRDDERDRPDASPRHAQARESWFAYQRFVDLLGGVSSASMIHPEAPSGAEVSIGGTTGYLVIFRFYRPLAAAPYAYLVLLDPTFNGDCSFMEVRLSWSGSAWNKTIAEAVPTEPRSVSMEVPVLVLPDGTVIERTTVPAGSAEYDDADDLTPLPRTFTFRAGDPPLIVRASGPLEWEVSYDCQRFDGPPERLVRIEFERAEKGTAEPSEIYLDGVRVWV